MGKKITLSKAVKELIATTAHKSVFEVLRRSIPKIEEILVKTEMNLLQTTKDELAYLRGFIGSTATSDPKRGMTTYNIRGWPCTKEIFDAFVNDDAMRGVLLRIDALEKIVTKWTNYKTEFDQYAKRNEYEAGLRDQVGLQDRRFDPLLVEAATEELKKVYTPPPSSSIPFIPEVFDTYYDATLQKEYVFLDGRWRLADFLSSQELQNRNAYLRGVARAHKKMRPSRLARLWRRIRSEKKR